MREPTFFILTALAGPPAHGYAIIRAVGELSGGRLTLRAGTLYAALERLTEEGLVEVDHEETVDGRHRRYYKITNDGAGALAAEVERMRADARAAAGRLRLAGLGGPVADGVG